MKVGEEKIVVLTGNDAYTQGPLAGKDLTFKIILREIK
jgi:FKBP-type peptidyl-prolyl cis-trans isomerase (trigger factor)